LFMMGNTRDNHLFLQILNILNRKNYNVIAVYTTLPEEMLPKLNENLLLKKFIHSPLLINKMVDLAVIHGGRGTVYNAAYSGKPSIGIPMFIEHQYNIDNIVKMGAGLRVSYKFFKKEKLLESIETIFSNYDEFLRNAQILSKSLTKEKSELKAAKRLIEIYNEKH
jgi:UDP:flavonoid glycosyltransferase YjiC (YdhE family)